MPVKETVKKHDTVPLEDHLSTQEAVDREPTPDLKLELKHLSTQFIPPDQLQAELQNLPSLPDY